MPYNTPHIAVIASYFYPRIGGLENYAYLLAKNLHEQNGYRITVITSNYDGNGHKIETIDGMTVHRLPVWFTLSNTPINPLWYWQIKDIFSADPPDVIHLHAPVPYMADMAALAAKNHPVMLTYHAGSMRKGSWLIDLGIGAYERVGLAALFRRANTVVAISQPFAKRTFPQFMHKTYFIPTGVDLQRFKETSLPETNMERVTYIGKIEHSAEWKGLEYLLRAMAIVITHHPHATLELVGGGDAIAHYRKRANELGIITSVTFSGPLLGNDLVQAYRRSSMIVLPSISDAEAFSIALIEGMASGRPLIGTNIGGIPQTIKDGYNGLLVPPKDPEELARAIERVLADRALAINLAGNGARLAKDFSWDIQTNKYATLFATLL